MRHSIRARRFLPALDGLEARVTLSAAVAAQAAAAEVGPPAWTPMNPGLGGYGQEPPVLPTPMDPGLGGYGTEPSADGGSLGIGDIGTAGDPVVSLDVNVDIDLFPTFEPGDPMTLGC